MSDSAENLLYVERTKGYKMKIFTTEITDVIRHIAACSVCEGIMRDPCVVTKGGVGTTCLSCRRDGVEHLLTDNIKSGIAILEVKCPLDERGCAWVGKLSGIEGHMESCGEFKLECPQKCNFVTKRSEIENHTKSQCPMRVVECEHCKQKMCYKELGIHFTICPEYPLKCVCGERHRRRNIETHERDKCLETVIECEYKRYGCNDRFKRKFKEEHGKENQAKHIDLKFQTLEKALGSLENQNKVLTAKVSEYPLKCVCGEKHKRKGIEIHKRDFCRETTIPCTYKEFGCEKTFKRIFLESHLEDNEDFHKNLKLTGLEAKVEKLEKEQSNRKAVELENERLKLENEQLRKMSQFNLVHDWTINTKCPTGDTKHDVRLPYSSYKVRFEHVPPKKELKLWISFEGFQRSFISSTYKFWTVLVNQDDNKLCGTPEGSVDYIYKQDNITSGRNFEIGTFSPEIVKEFVKNGLLNVKVYYKVMELMEFVDIEFI